METGKSSDNLGVLLVEHGEPETYKFSEWLKEFKNMFGELKDTQVAVPPKILWPLLAWSIKSHYKAVGGKSPHEAVSKKQLALVRKEIPECEIYLCYLEMVQPCIAASIHQMIKDGIKKIIAIPVLLTESSHTEEIKEIIEEVKEEHKGIEILLTHPLFYKASSLATMCAQLILNRAQDTPLHRVGVLLASHGEPDEWVKLKLINTRCNEQETTFRNIIRKELITLGFKDENITDAYNEFVTPKITPAVEKIAGSVDKIVVIPTFGAAEGLHHIYDIPTKARKAKVPPTTKITCITTWAHEPSLIKALADLYRDALRGEVYQSPVL